MIKTLNLVTASGCSARTINKIPAKCHDELFRFQSPSIRLEAFPRLLHVLDEVPQLSIYVEGQTEAAGAIEIDEESQDASLAEIREVWFLRHATHLAVFLSYGFVESCTTSIRQIVLV